MKSEALYIDLAENEVITIAFCWTTSNSGAKGARDAGLFMRSFQAVP